MSITPTRFSLSAGWLLVKSAIKFESSVLHVERSSHEADHLQACQSDVAGPESDETAVDPVRGAFGNLSKSQPPQLSHSLRNGRFYLSLSSHWSARFCQD